MFPWNTVRKLAIVPIEDRDMERGVRIVLAAGVLLGGSGLALMFRQPAALPVPAQPAPADHLVLRGQSEPIGDGSRADRPMAGIEAPPRKSRPAASPSPPWALLEAAGSAEPPPRLARSYPEPFPESEPWEVRHGTSPWAAAPVPMQQTHRVVDGDTLENLADRYLGSADRAGEIFQANRRELDSPDVLPIGAELVIPPLGAPPEQEPLVPVR